MTAKNNFRRNLIANRKAKNRTQQQMADDLIIGRARLGAYEEGRGEPSIDLLIEMAKYFDTTIDELVK